MPTWYTRFSKLFSASRRPSVRTPADSTAVRTASGLSLAYPETSAAMRVTSAMTCGRDRSAAATARPSTRCRRARARHDRHGQARDADQAQALVVDADLPDLGRTAEVNRARRAGDDTVGHAAQVVRVDVEADGELRRCVGDHNRPEAAERFGQRDR